MIKKIVFCFVLLLTGASGLVAQLTHSPFSRYGLGDIFDPSNTRSFSMGGTGIAIFDPAVINRNNPGSYGDLKLTSLDFNGYVSYRMLRTADSANFSPTGGFQSISLGFSSRKNFGIIFGLAPYSATNYSIITRNSLLVDTTTEAYSTTYQADGGLNQFYIGAGVRLFQRLSVGANATYAFGNTNYRWNTHFDNSSYNDVNIRRRTTLTGFIPQIGAQYGDTLRIVAERKVLVELDHLDKSAGRELKFIAKQDSGLMKDKAKLNREAAALNDKKKAYTAEQETIQKQIEPLMQNERANEKLIGKLQERNFKLEKFKKKIDQKIKQSDKEWTREHNNIIASRNKIIGEQKINARKRAEVISGERDSVYSKTSKFLARVGVVWQPSMNLMGDQITTFNNNVVGDTADQVINDSRISIPMRIGTGVSLGKPNHWTVGADLSIQSWSQLEYFNDVNSLQNSMRLSIGGEFIPKYNSMRMSDRIAWRAGIWYEKTSLTIAGASVNDMGISLGMGIPLGRLLYPGAVSRINLGVAIGSRGSIAQQGLQEGYVAIRVGMNLNDLWFLRQRID